MALFTPEQEARIQELALEAVGKAGAVFAVVNEKGYPIDPPNTDIWRFPWPELATEDEKKMVEADTTECIERARRGVGWAGNRFGGQETHRKEVDDLAVKPWEKTDWFLHNVDRDLVFTLILDGTIRVVTREGQPPSQPDDYENMTLQGWLEGNLNPTGSASGVDPV